jgi:hypothetical protein
MRDNPVIITNGLKKTAATSGARAFLLHFQMRPAFVVLEASMHRAGLRGS